MKEKSSKYKGVSKCTHSKYTRYNNNWKAQYDGEYHKWQSCFETEREAALAYDKKMIELGLEPVNILVRKK